MDTDTRQLSDFTARYRFFCSHPDYCNGHGVCPACGYPTLGPSPDYYCCFCGWDSWDYRGESNADDMAPPNDNTLSEARQYFEQTLCVWDWHEQDDFSPSFRWQLFSHRAQKAKRELKQAYDLLMNTQSSEQIETQWQAISEIDLPCLARLARQSYRVKLDWHLDVRKTYSDPPGHDLFFQPRLQLSSERTKYEIDTGKTQDPLPFSAGENVFDNDDLVWDIGALVKSTIEPGGYHVFNCSCGFPEDTDIHERVCVSHPDKETIAWEMDIKGYDAWWSSDLQGKSGYIQFLFNRSEYEASINLMLEAIDEYIKSKIPVDEIPPSHDFVDNEKVWLSDLKNSIRQPRKALLHTIKDIKLDTSKYPFILFDGQPAEKIIDSYFSKWSALNAFRILQDYRQSKKTKDIRDAQWVAETLVINFRSCLYFTGENDPRSRLNYNQEVASVSYL